MVAGLRRCGGWSWPACEESRGESAGRLGFVAACLLVFALIGIWVSRTTPSMAPSGKAPVTVTPGVTRRGLRRAGLRLLPAVRPRRHLGGAPAPAGQLRRHRDRRQRAAGRQRGWPTARRRCCDDQAVQDDGVAAGLQPTTQLGAQVDREPTSEPGCKAGVPQLRSGPPPGAERRAPSAPLAARPNGTRDGRGGQARVCSAGGAPADPASSRALVLLPPATRPIWWRSLRWRPVALPVVSMGQKTAQPTGGGLRFAAPARVVAR
jgi:hypothetical protein